MNLASVAVAVVAILHAFFLVLRCFSGKRPTEGGLSGCRGKKRESTAKLAANQGLYNGF